MSAVAERIEAWTAPRANRGSELLLLDASQAGDPHWYWFARDTIGPIGSGGPHPTKRDALEEAHDRCPGWQTITCL